MHLRNLLDKVKTTASVCVFDSRVSLIGGDNLRHTAQKEALERGVSWCLFVGSGGL